MLNIVLIIAVLAITGSIVYISYFLVKTLRSIEKLANNLEERAEDIKLLQNQFKLGAFTSLAGFLINLAGKFIRKRR